MILAAFVALAFLLGGLCLWVDYHKPIRQFADAVHQLATGKIKRIDPDGVSGDYRRISEWMDEAIDNAARTAQEHEERNAEVQNLLASQPPNPQAASYFGFAKRDSNPIPPAPRVPTFAQHEEQSPVAPRSGHQPSIPPPPPQRR